MRSAIRWLGVFLTSLAGPCWAEAQMYRCGSVYSNVSRGSDCVAIGEAPVQQGNMWLEMLATPAPTKPPETAWGILALVALLVGAIVALVAWHDKLGRLLKPALVGAFIMAVLCILPVVNAVAQWLTTTGFLGVGPAYGVTLFPVAILVGATGRSVWRWEPAVGQQAK